jgi:hypothetical protein
MQINSIKAAHPTRNVQSCPDNTPYLAIKSGTGVCSSCPSSQYFAVVSEKCIEDCPSGTIYNSTVQMCKVG